MTAKEFFRQVRRAESEIKVLNVKLSHYEDLGFSMGGAAGVIGNKQKGSSRVEMAAIGAVDVLRDLEEQRREYIAIIARAEQIIRAIPQEKFKRVLDYRYLCGWSFRSISDELRYKDPNSIYRVHGFALTAAQRVMDRLVKQDD